MNKRIKELERQATETVRCGLNGTSTAESFNRKKFAELIVRECLVQIVDAIPDTNCSAADAYKTAKLAATSRVKELFGVE